jgi:hypothetical protein
MKTILADEQIEQWRQLRDGMTADGEFMQRMQERSRNRQGEQKELNLLLSHYLQGELAVEEFRATFDKNTRKAWPSFGLKGMNGAMVLNQLVKYSPDEDRLNRCLKQCLPVPPDVTAGRDNMKAFIEYLDGLKKGGHIPNSRLQTYRTAFFLSAWWHLQDSETWPIYYPNTSRLFQQKKIFDATKQPIEDYFRFRDIFLTLAGALKLTSWELEYLCFWPGNTPPDPDPPPPRPVIEDNGDEKQPTSHTQVQYHLAKLGRQLGCKIWIAPNDRRKKWEGQDLGSMSEESLPPLGMDADSQKVISMIDVVWLRGAKQVVAAFEIEQTTSIYSGLLRMADLVALVPNISFPLYIVTPTERMEKVRRELSRPTFQVLELHKRCGFFSNEALLKAYEGMMKWATDPMAINNLAEKVEDI